MGLTQERHGEIALVMVRYYLDQQGVKIHKNFGREVGNTLKSLNDFDEHLNLSDEEAVEFSKKLVMEVVDRAFHKIQVQIAKKKFVIHDKEDV